MHSFSILLAITLEFVFSMQFWTPIARNLRSPNSIASYSAMLLLHLSASAVNCKRATYLNLMLEGDVRIAAALASEALHARHSTHAMVYQSPGPQCNLRDPSSLL
jgi:hypothetical protein